MRVVRARWIAMCTGLIKEDKFVNINLEGDRFLDSSKSTKRAIKNNDSMISLLCHRPIRRFQLIDESPTIARLTSNQKNRPAHRLTLYGMVCTAILLTDEEGFDETNV